MALLFAACGVAVEPAFCNTALSAISTVNQKGALCLAESSFAMEPSLVGVCETEITSACDEMDIARVDQWISCWEEVPACSTLGAEELIALGNQCARDADLSAVNRGCLALFGERSAEPSALVHAVAAAARQ